MEKVQEDESRLKRTEKHYRNLNESLKQKTSALIAQAEKALEQQLTLSCTLDSASINAPSERVDEDDFVNECADPRKERETWIRNTNGSLLDEPEAFSDDFDSPKEDELVDIDNTALNVKSVVKIYRTKLKVVSSELQHTKTRFREATAENSSLVIKLKESEQKVRTLLSDSEKTLSELAQLKKTDQNKTKEIESYKNETAALKKHCKINDHKVQECSMKTKLWETKLSRANEDISRLERLLEDEKKRGSDESSHHRDQVKLMETNLRKLETDKQCVVSGFEKQRKLIDVLKRQKQYILASKLLQISEDEFLKVFGSDLKQ